MFSKSLVFLQPKNKKKKKKQSEWLFLSVSVSPRKSTETWKWATCNGFIVTDDVKEYFVALENEVK